MRATLRKRQSFTKKQALLFLEELWSFYNKTKFSKKLKKPKISFSNSLKYLGAYKVKLKNNKIINSTILINTDLFFNDEEWLLKDTLLHEMAHQYCCEIQKKLEDFHGLHWKKICRKIGARPIIKHRNSHQEPTVILLD